ncbi:MAG: B12-binding domain-containing radical SAM protein [Desulfomonile tiedjei]|nr:B12-binding domain-containing radical SAM protein [Desulfomonile tiedjei]
MSTLASSGLKNLDFEVLSPQISDVLGDRGLALEIARRRPFVIAMTLYVWNVERSLFLASDIKRRFPGTTILAGGPEVTPDNLWVLRHPAVDVGVFGEGESRIAAVMDALLKGKSLEHIPGVFFKDQGEVCANLGPAPAWDLSSCPYPYLDGRILPSRDGTLFLETVRGCPFQCRYCYYHKAFQQTRFHPRPAVENVLDFAYSRDSAVREIYLMDPTFNARKGFRTLLRSMAGRRRQKDLALHTELRADSLTADDVGLLKDAGLVSAEIGLQTTNLEALREAGRRQEPAKVARGVTLLKEAGIEVTTGIILGLPKDTPEGFSATLKWLKQTGAYSVVHPFVLSMLPGTDFKSRASSLGIRYDHRPPYYVRSTPTFPEHRLRTALLECEKTFDMELDYIPPPSLVDRGTGLISRPDQTTYVSKWIVDLQNEPDWPRVAPEVISKATDPFVLWFRGVRTTGTEKAMLQFLRDFALANPHACLHLVLEFSEPPDLPFFRKALEVSADPGLFVNRSYAPLYGEDEVVSLNFTVVLPDPGDHRRRSSISNGLGSMASVVWDWKTLDDARLMRSDAPLLVSPPMADLAGDVEGLLNVLQGAHEDHPEEVLFRDPLLQQIWDYRFRKLDPAAGWPERILNKIWRVQ